MTASLPVPVSFDPRWRTSDSVGVARGIYEDRAFGRMPILADALMDAGCGDEQIIHHCHGDGPHDENCWVLGLVLGLESKIPRLDWQKVYQTLGMENQYEKRADQFDLVCSCALWPILVLKGVTCNKVIEVLRKLGVNVYCYDEDLDREVTVNDRNPAEGSYLIRVRARIEADEENQSQSANHRQRKKYKDATLLERLLLELAYFLATRQHLDNDNWTLCAGSRYSSGLVPGVRWSSGGRELYVDWLDSDHAFSGLRARSVVSSS